MKLDNLYSLRRSFTVIGLTGRTGSGCTNIATLLSGSYNNLKKKGLRDFTQNNDDNLFKRKYDIVSNYISSNRNWMNFDVISYRNVLLFYIFNKYGNSKIKISRLLLKYYKESEAEDNKAIVASISIKIVKLFEKNQILIEKIMAFNDFEKIKSKEDLLLLNEIFFGKDFKSLCKNLFNILQSNKGYFKRTLLLHYISCNIRQSGDPMIEGSNNISSIYNISNFINRIIKARKLYKTSKGKPTKIVIDSLRNSLEIMFFKERYSAFYMIATQDVLNTSRERIIKRLPKSIIDSTEKELLANKLIELDETEYLSKDFSKGIFSSPDVENCIQKSDFHILNLKQEHISDFLKVYNPPFGKSNFLTREEQLLKLIALISQPGIISPSSLERSMQIANTAKLNSGCISRSVGAVITDSDFYIKSVGWNDVAKGHTPCNLRNVNDLIYPENEEFLENNLHYSDFEKGLISKTSDYKYKNEDKNSFKSVLKDYFEESLKKNSNDLNGKNCSFCFKTIHNHYEGEANQVHTRSLHAEENAMLQITKLGGQGVKNGFLFTTASPCELCSKKAYQLGIKTIFYIDPYPGISQDQILKGGSNITRPIMIPFSGAIGNAYHKLYETFMSYKDEVSMTLEIKSKNKFGIQFKGILKKLKNKDENISNYLKENKNITDEDVINLLSEAIENRKK